MQNSVDVVRPMFLINDLINIHVGESKLSRTLLANQHDGITSFYDLLDASCLKDLAFPSENFRYKSRSSSSPWRKSASSRYENCTGVAAS